MSCFVCSVFLASHLPCSHHTLDSSKPFLPIQMDDLLTDRSLSSPCFLGLSIQCFQFAYSPFQHSYHFSQLTILCLIWCCHFWRKTICHCVDVVLRRRSPWKYTIRKSFNNLHMPLGQSCTYLEGTGVKLRKRKKPEKHIGTHMTERAGSQQAQWSVDNPESRLN